MKKFTALLIILLMSLSLCSCEAMSVEESAEIMLSAIKENDKDTLKKHVETITLFEMNLPDVITDALYSNCTWVMGEVTEIDSKHKDVEVTFTNIDVNHILSAAGSEISRLTFDEKNIDSDTHSADVAKIYLSTLQENSGKTVSETVTISFTKISGNWIGSFDEAQSKELLSSMFGGYEF